MPPNDPSAYRLRVWDLPTRIFHWALAAAVVALIITGQIAGNWIVWHFRLGVTVGALLVFRLFWGLIGGRWSRFATFLPRPAAALAYLRGSRTADTPGHNPLGAFSVYAMLFVLIAQVGTGLVADDEIANYGPRNAYVSTSTAELATSWHKAWGQYLIFALVGLHLAALVWYAMRGQRLVPGMITGDRDWPVELPGSRDDLTSRVLAAILLALCGWGAWWVLGLGG